MAQIIDRRLNGKNKSAVNRQRFIRRYKKQIKQAVSNAISKRSITNIESSEKIIIPAKDILEPIFHHANGGIHEAVHPGNQDFITGDKIKRPPTGNSKEQDSQASNTGEGKDDFVFNLSKEEFLEIYFDDLELPDLVKKQISQVKEFKNKRAGFTHDGTPNNINIIRSLRTAMSRRIALSNQERIDLKEKIQLLTEYMLDEKNKREEIEILKLEIEALEKRIKSIPFIDDFDIRYNNTIKQPLPTTKAVMFCVMDVSGSMDEIKKDIAKRFFILLYLFLSRNYEKTELVFIRHHTSAKEVDEEDFFYSRETGGTVVSSALELTKTIIEDRFPASEWNIYVAQASDGDNWNADSPHCQEILSKDILPHLQYYAYIEIMPRYHQSLWQAYLAIKEIFPNFEMQHINSTADIYPVFRELFKRQKS